MFIDPDILNPVFIWLNERQFATKRIQPNGWPWYVYPDWNEGFNLPNILIKLHSEKTIATKWYCIDATNAPLLADVHRWKKRTQTHSLCKWGEKHQFQHERRELNSCFVHHTVPDDGHDFLLLLSIACGAFARWMELNIHQIDYDNNYVRNAMICQMENWIELINWVLCYIHNKSHFILYTGNSKLRCEIDKCR